jgi:DNA-binding transcriptional ArsR family regulator
MGDLPELDPIVHGQVRLAILSLLAGVEEAEFTFLRDRTGATDGNISVHLAKLEDARYVSVSKRFVDRKPRSFYRLTEKGRTALLSYIDTLRRLLGPNLGR